LLEEALLTGNGTIGAMAIGRPHDETIILNHALLYLPASDRLAPINQAGRLEEIRRLLLSGKYAEATKIPMQLGEADGYGGTRWTDPFMPALDIRIDMSGSNVKDYARAVNFTTGEASVVWRDENGSYRRDLFASRADSCVVIRIKGSGKSTRLLNSVCIRWNGVSASWSLARLSRLRPPPRTNG
jgi:hypothetical protein